jgi:hypothetical protein
MDYRIMSDDELYQSLNDNFHGPSFKHVTDDNRQTVIRILEANEERMRRDENRRFENA